MIRLSTYTLCLATFCLLAAPSSAAAKPGAKGDDPLVCWALPSLMSRYFEHHVSHRKTDEALSERVVSLYADGFDPSKALLLQTDFDALRAQLRRLISQTQQGNCDDFQGLKTAQRAWHKNMAEFVKTAMQKVEEIDQAVELQVDADKRSRPKTKAEQQALRHKLLQFQLANYVASGTALPEAKKKLIRRYELLSKRVSELDDADMYGGFLNAFSSALDPHSTYFSADDLEDFRISMDLALEGIGAVLSSRDGYTTVQEVVTGGAAARHGGLKTKDKIIAVGQGEKGESVDVIDMSLRDVVRKIRGKKGTQVKLTVLRQGEKNETHVFLITRDKIDLKKQAAKLRWETVDRDGQPIKLAVLDLPSFYGGDRAKGARNCVDDVRNFIKEAKAQKADGMLIDLSKNGGGLLKAAVQISGLFLAEGPVVAVDGPGSPTQILEDQDDKTHFNGPLVVLVSRVSASASEIVAGALKDYDRAVIVGDDHTFGKGTVQNIINLPPGFGALKVTTALFFRPGGQSTQNTGVSADLIVPTMMGNEDYGEKHQPYALPTRSIEKFGNDQVNSDGPEEQWAPISSKQMAILADRSEKRLAASDDFKKLKETLAKRQKNQGVVKIAEILNDPEKKSEDEKEDDAKEKPSAQAKEAVQILADLVMTSRS